MLKAEYFQSKLELTFKPTPELFILAQKYSSKPKKVLIVAIISTLLILSFGVLS